MTALYHSHYHHKTLAGNLLFYGGALVLIIAGIFVNRIPDPATRKLARRISSIAGFAVVILSYIVELVLS